MGLIADYVEDLREREIEYDPCLLFGYFAKESRHAYKDIKERIYSIEEEKPTADDWLKYKQEFVDKLHHLEYLKNEYLLQEKALLSIKNEIQLSSSLIYDLVHEACNQVRISYSEVCSLSHQIKCQFPNILLKPVERIDEDAILHDLLQRIIASALYALNRNSHIDTSRCRKIISDCARIIKQLEQEPYNLPDKEVFDYFITNTGGLKKGNIQCSNCGRYLYIDFPYCVNCYERN